MSSIRVLLAEDHALVRAGIRMLLEKLDGVEVVGEVRDGAAAVEAVANHHPDILLMDIAMPGLNGLEAAARVRKECPGVRVIVLSMYTTEAYLHQALKHGAVGYLVKDAERSELELAIRTVMRGDTYLTPAVAKFAVDAFRQRTEAEAGPLQKLTPRQREILQLIAEGHTTKDIARHLDLSVRTVETHRAELMARLDIHDVPGLVRLAIQAGLVSSQSP
ncbi:MAG TPA: response regulator transcription factor [Nitrospira sp.]|nr:response regulator transcription factor [Nitrospira sp.]